MRLSLADRFAVEGGVHVHKSQASFSGDDFASEFESEGQAIRALAKVALQVGREEDEEHACDLLRLTLGPHGEGVVFS